MYSLRDSKMGRDPPVEDHCGTAIHYWPLSISTDYYKDIHW